MKAMTWQNLNYEMVAMDDFLMFVFPSPPMLVSESVCFEGGEVCPGDRINGLFGPGTSAVNNTFHPVAPGHFVYEGTYRDLNGEIVVCRCPGREEHDGAVIKYGWKYSRRTGHLFALLRCSGTVRSVQSSVMFLNDAMPPLECLDDKYYWKKKLTGKVAA